MSYNLDKLKRFNENLETVLIFETGNDMRTKKAFLNHQNSAKPIHTKIRRNEK